MITTLESMLNLTKNIHFTQFLTQTYSEGNIQCVLAKLSPTVD